MIKEIKENKFLVATLSLLVFATIYGLLAQLFIDASSWKELIYDNLFVSIQPMHLSLWSAFILVNILCVLHFTVEFSKARVFYKLFVVLIMSSFGMWFVFDAFNRSFATLPEIVSFLSEIDVIEIVLMSVLEIAIGISMIVLAITLMTDITSSYIDKRNKKIDKYMKVVDWYAIGLYSLVFISQLLVFITYNKNGIGDVTNRRWPNIGPQSQGLIALIGLFYAWRRIVNTKLNDSRDWRMNIITTIIFSLTAGFFFHDNILFIYDYVNGDGRYHTEQVWNVSSFMDISTWLLIITIPLLLILMLLYISKLVVLIKYISEIKLTKKDRKRIIKEQAKEKSKKLSLIKKDNRKTIKQKEKLLKKAEDKKTRS